MRWKEKLIIALDVSDAQKALDIVERLSDYTAVFKVGFELFTTAGPKIVEEIHKKGKEVFLDLKFHDIPNTVSKAAAAAAKMGVYMFNVHTSGGFEMMKRCRDSVSGICAKDNIRMPKIIGVTVLTSLNNEALKGEVGIQHSLRNHVKHLASLAVKAGLDGVVASPHEISIIKQHCGKDFLVVTPGIRPSWTPPDDQQRTATPKEALKKGADYIVMGRGILQQEDPIKALELISLEILTA
ncbi:MAG TPA: orotidine-5'-phosphate decarboxylase [Nitrospiraceae bacterium]|nr:MAG: orotidine 5'-phosphate decarboxylase [Nitrospirae bacterium GWA2_46_11]OGW25160.1 MAG: orotidine 5'-phosphate decarboxylase [Nitrospirae bacterium GWB2_47_37]HAK89560.1 orotidine-5'-phosphate decarboxylase [Nitrospiraceae bacterium]HCZ12066.1 orotidine-5'-phosphate decarboxylase [Nitrospiraceae bacterium]